MLTSVPDAHITPTARPALAVVPDKLVTLTFDGELDRTLTVQALPLILEGLEQKGY